MIKLLESLREIFSGLGLHSLLSYKLKAQETKNIYTGLHQNKNFLCFKDNHLANEKITHRMRNIFKSYI